MLLFPMVYIFQYLAGLFFIWILVDGLRLDQRIAPLLVPIITIPFTFLMSNYVFLKK